MSEGAYLESLIAEYAELFRQGSHSPEKEQKNLQSDVCALTESADWSNRGADEIARLARDYGSFMLRNALAIAIVLGIEDGELGF